MSHSDSTFFKPFAFVLGALVIFTLFIMFIANSLSPDSPDDPLAIAEMQKSIAPVGQSRVVAAPMTEQASASQAPASTQAPVAELQTPATVAEVEDTATQTESSSAVVEQTMAESTDTETAAADTSVAMPMGEVPVKVKAAVATNCAGCHNPGLNGAAQTQDAQAWSALADKGLDTLTASVINGLGKMPARAESSLSDEELAQAVQLMIANATGDSVGPATAIAATATEPKEAESTDTQVVAAETPAEVKQVVDSTCAACHLVGVANAPKFGDKEAWGQRMEKGLDALTASAIAGIGVMPPKGGSSLSDEQMKLAIEYILIK